MMSSFWKNLHSQKSFFPLLNLASFHTRFNVEEIPKTHFHRIITKIDKIIFESNTLQISVQILCFFFSVFFEHQLRNLKSRTFLLLLFQRMFLSCLIFAKYHISGIFGGDRKFGTCKIILPWKEQVFHWGQQFHTGKILA